MGVTMREYLTVLDEEELNELELEVLKSKTNPGDNIFLKSINEEREYRKLKKIYDELKLGLREDKNKFINANPVDLLTIYRGYKKDKLFNYLEGKTSEELKELEDTLINKYKFLENDPIVVIIRDRYNYLDLLNADSQYINTDLLLEYHNKEVLSDYLQLLTIDELNSIYAKVVEEIVSNKEDLDLERISMLDEIISERESRNNENTQEEGKLK